MFKAKIYVTLKLGILDPQGKAVNDALNTMGYAQVEDVRIGKYLVVTLNQSDRVKAEEQVREMCTRLLSNPVMEDFTFELQDVDQ